MQERLRYIDIAKGILITFVCYHHFPQSVRYVFDLENVDFGLVRSTYQFYNCFFMQAFFFITGLCSNFEKDTKTFLIKNIKTLVIPALLFIIIHRFVNAVFWEATIEDTFDCDLDFWFLYTLFLCKLLMFGILKIISEKWQIPLLVVVSLMMVLAGSFCCYHFHNCWNWFNYQNCLAMFFFLVLGYAAKKHLSNYNKLLPLGAIGYGVILILHFTIGYKLPCITHYANLAKSLIPNYIICATTGSFCILYISKLIGECRIIENLDKYSLLIYGFHFIILKFISYGIITLFNVDMQQSVSVFTCFIISCTLTAVVAYFLSYLITRTKLLNLLTGKW